METKDIKNDRREEIIGAAKELFAREGYAQTSMDDIARKVGINKASLYYFFKSKEQIFGEIIKQVLDEAKEHLKKLKGSGQVCGVPLSEVIYGLIQVCLKNGIVIRPIDIKISGASEKTIVRFKTALLDIKELLREILKCYNVPCEKLAAEVLSNALHAYVIHSKHNMTICKPREYSDYLASLFVK